jgi:hypothetical protein
MTSLASADNQRYFGENLTILSDFIPDDGLYRYSMGYGTGSAGGVSCLHRLSQGGDNLNFFVGQIAILMD